MKRISRIVGLSLFLTIAWLTVAPGEENNAADTSPAEWTVMVFMNGDNNLEEDAITDFGEMATVGSTEKVNILVQFDRIPGWYTTSPPEKDWTQTLRFRITKGMKPLKENALEDLGEVNMGDGKALADFVKWGREKYPAKRFMLVIWDHGQGWRFFETVRLNFIPEQRVRHFEDRLRQIEAQVKERTVSRDDKGRSIVETIPFGTGIESPFHRSCSDDWTNNDHLYNREIQDILERILGGKKLDLIGFDACLMAMMETTYAMRKVGDVMVGSEELEPGTGWDYSDWLPRLVADPTMNAEALGKVLVESYAKTYGPNSAQTQSAIRLGKDEPVAVAVSALADGLMAKLDDELGHIKSARRACLRYGGGSYALHGIDLDRFCEQYEAATTDAVLKKRANEIREQIKQAVVAAYAGKLRQGEYGSKGLAIYFPETGAAFQVDPSRDGYTEANTVHPVQFIQDHRWDNFLHAYYKKVP